MDDLLHIGFYADMGHLSSMSESFFGKPEDLSDGKRQIAVGKDELSKNTIQEGRSALVAFEYGPRLVNESANVRTQEFADVQITCDHTKKAGVHAGRFSTQAVAGK